MKRSYSGKITGGREAGRVGDRGGAVKVKGKDPRPHEALADCVGSGGSETDSITRRNPRRPLPNHLSLPSPRAGKNRLLVGV